jgi:iron complex outermembrane receptor protein
MCKSLATASLAALTTGFLFAATAQAQTVSYSDLEDLFGQPVTTSATGKPQPASEAPADMTIITADEIRRSGANNIPDILAQQAGVDIRRDGSGYTNISIRGYDSAVNPRLLVLINGRQVYLDNFGYTNWNALPVALSQIRQIEIVRGPQTALFGFNAVAGVVNIITYDPLRDDTNVGTARVGTQSYVDGDAVGTYRTERYGISLSAGASSMNEFSNKSAVAANDLYELHNPTSRFVAIDGRAKVSPDVEVGVEITGVNAVTNLYAPGAYYFGSDLRNYSIKGYVAASTPIGTITGTVYSNQQIDTDVLGAGVQFYSNEQVTVAQLADVFRVDSHNTFRVAMEYRRNDEEVSSINDGDVGYDLFSGSVMWDYANLLPGLSLTNAGRIDSLDLGRVGTFPAGLAASNAAYDARVITRFSYNSGLVYKVTPSDALTLTAGRGIQAPSLLNFGASLIPLLGGVVYTTGSPSLEPTVVTNYEAAWSHHFTEPDIKTSASVYTQTSKDLLIDGENYPFDGVSALIGPAPPFFAQNFYNDGTSSATGIEFSAKGVLDTVWHWSANWSMIAIMDNKLIVHNGSGTAGLLSSFDFQHGTPTHTVNIGGGYADGPYEADLNLRYQTSYNALRQLGTTYDLFVIPDQLDLSGRIAYKPLDWLTLSFNAGQLNNSYLATAGGIQSERRLFGQVVSSF